VEGPASGPLPTMRWIAERNYPSQFVSEVA
jgi:hypothetical protein